MRLGYAVTTILVMAALGGIYLSWQHLRPPSLELNNWQDKGVDLRIVSGKQVYIDEYELRNFGRQTCGITIELSGSALENDSISNPCVLMNSQDKTTMEFPPSFSNQTRNYLPLAKLPNGVWSTKSESTILQHKNDFMVESLGMFPLMFGLCNNLTEHNFTIQLFADVSNNAKGSMKLKVNPIEYPSIAVQMTNHIAVRRGKQCDVLDPLPCEGIPASFPVSAYPGSQIAILSNYQVRLDSKGSVPEIISYYKKRA